MYKSWNIVESIKLAILCASFIFLVFKLVQTRETICEMAT